MNKRAVLAGAAITALPVLSITCQANPALEAFLGLHDRRSINAVSFDGNTCLRAPTIWNPARSPYFFALYSSAPSHNNTHRNLARGGQEILYVTGPSWVHRMEPDGVETSNQAGVLVQFQEQEQPNASDNSPADLYFKAYTVDENNEDVVVYAKTTDQPLPRDGAYRTIAVTINLLTLKGYYATETLAGLNKPIYKDGALDVSSSGSPTNGGGQLNWATAKNIYLGCDQGASVDNFTSVYNYYWNQSPGFHGFIMDTQWERDISGILDLFVNAQGQRYGMSTPGTRDFALTSYEPLIPNMGQDGNGNAFPSGPGPDLQRPAYVLDETSGTIQTAPNPPGDICKFRGIGDGCIR